MIPSLSPKRNAQHAWDITQFPSDVEASCSSPCSCSSFSSSPSPEHLGLPASQTPFLRRDHLLRRNVVYTTKDGFSYADGDGEFDSWARLKLYPESFTQIDEPSIHAVEGEQPGPDIFEIGYPSPDDDACWDNEKGLYFTFVMDTPTEFSSLTTSSHAGSAYEAESSVSIGHDGQVYNAERKAAIQSLRSRRLSRSSASQRYSPLGSARRAKTSKILDWVANVENVRPKPFGLQNDVIAGSQLIESDEVLYGVGQGSDESIDYASSIGSSQSSFREMEQPVFALSSPCPTEIILSTSPHSQMSGQGFDWSYVDEAAEIPIASGFRHAAAHSPQVSSRSSSPYDAIVTGPSQFNADGIASNKLHRIADDERPSDTALTFHRTGRMTNGVESFEIEEEVRYSHDGYVQAITTATHRYPHSLSSYPSLSSHPFSFHSNGSCCDGLSDMGDSGAWASKRSGSYEQSVYSEFVGDVQSPVSGHSYAALSRHSYHDDAYYGEHTQASSSGSHYSYPPSMLVLNKASTSTSSAQNQDAVSPMKSAHSRSEGLVNKTSSSHSSLHSIPLYQPQPIRPILTISISELAAAEELANEGTVQSPSKMKRTRRAKPSRRPAVHTESNSINRTNMSTVQQAEWTQS